MSFKRIMLSASALLSSGVFVWAALPRIIAWGGTANANLIAEQRAATCDLMVGTVELGQLTNQNPGRYACYWDGSTGQVSNDRRLIHIKNGQPERIQSILKLRGFKHEANKENK